MSELSINHKYLISLHSRVDEFLSNNGDAVVLPDAVVSFCIIVERIIKNKLYDKNPVLVFDNSKLKDIDCLISIVDKKDKNIETVKMFDALDRFNKVYEGTFSEDEIQVIKDIYFVRNNFVHGYKIDNDSLIEEDIIKKLGTVWEKVSNQSKDVLGESDLKISQPKKKYSEEELEKVLVEEVKKKIMPEDNFVHVIHPYDGNAVWQDFTSNTDNPFVVSPHTFVYQGEQCPRCKTFSLVWDGVDSDLLFGPVYFNMYNNPEKSPSNLYKCKKCNLELTKREYELVKSL